MDVWNNVIARKASKVDEIRSVIPEYDYSSEDLDHRTDESVCNFLVTGLHEAKDMLFNIIHTQFEIHNDAISNEFQEIRDSVDVFSDEIKCRHFDWDECNAEKWLERVIDHDYAVILGMIRFTAELENVIHAIGDVNQNMQLYLDSLRQMLNDLVTNFKERDVICNIKEITFERTFQMIQKEMRS